MQIPVDFQPNSLLENFPQPSIVAMVILYVRYFNCLTMALCLSFWKVGHLEAYRASFENLPTNPCPSHRLCIESARTAVRLYSLLPSGDVPCMWLLNDYFISAVVILLAGIIYDSSLSMGWQDLQIVEPVIGNLDIMAQRGDAERLRHIKSNCDELMQAASNLVCNVGNAENTTFSSVAFKQNLQDDQSLAWLYADVV